MRKVILQEFVSLDGFAADEKGTTRFFDFMAGEEGKEVDEDLRQFIDTIDTILLGAETYRMFVDYWPTATTDTELVADKLNETPKIVFSKTLDKASWGQWEDAKVVKTGVAEEIANLKKQKGKDMVVWGSISLAQFMMKDSLIDEYQLRVCPVVLGKGRSLFSSETSMLPMKLLNTKTYANKLVYLRYSLGNK